MANEPGELSLSLEYFKEYVMAQYNDVLEKFRNSSDDIAVASQYGGFLALSQRALILVAALLEEKTFLPQEKWNDQINMAGQDIDAKVALVLDKKIIPDDGLYFAPVMELVMERLDAQIKEGKIQHDGMPFVTEVFGDVDSKTFEVGLEAAREWISDVAIPETSPAMESNMDIDPVQKAVIRGIKHLSL